MFFLFVFCKDNVLYVDFWWCNEKVFLALHSYLPITLSFCNGSMFYSIVHMKIAWLYVCLICCSCSEHNY